MTLTFELIFVARLAAVVDFCVPIFGVDCLIVFFLLERGQTHTQTVLIIIPTHISAYRLAYRRRG